MVPSLSRSFRPTSSSCHQAVSFYGLFECNKPPPPFLGGGGLVSCHNFLLSNFSHNTGSPELEGRCSSHTHHHLLQLLRPQLPSGGQTRQELLLGGTISTISGCSSSGGSSGLWTLQSLELAYRFAPQEPQAQPALPLHWLAFLLGAPSPLWSCLTQLQLRVTTGNKASPPTTKTARASASIQEKATF